MDSNDFTEKLVLIIVDKGLLAIFLLLLGLYVNQILEKFKGQLSKEQEAQRNSNQAVVDLTKKLASGSHHISWLSWCGTEPEPRLTKQSFAAYDKEMIAVLSDLVGLQALVAALSSKNFGVLSAFAERLYLLDIEMGRARDFFGTGHADKIRQSIEILKDTYQKALKFDAELLAAVTGLLEKPTSTS